VPTLLPERNSSENTPSGSPQRATAAYT